MILGIGSDLIEVSRVEKACQKDAFLSRMFTKKECQQAEQRSSKFAGNFAIKEAVAKAFGTGFRTFMPIDVEVLREPNGKPYVLLHGNAKELASEMHVSNIHVSITNTNEYAMGFVVLESDEGR